MFQLREVRESPHPGLASEERGNVHEELAPELYSVVIWVSKLKLNIVHGLEKSGSVARRLKLVQHRKVSFKK